MDHYETVARAAAAYAHEGVFSSRRGFLPADSHTIVMYDNNPTAGDSRLRDQQLAALKRAAAAHGCKLVGEAGYPVGGESDGYTVALVWILPGGDAASYMDIIRTEWGRIIRSI